MNAALLFCAQPAASILLIFAALPAHIQDRSFLILQKQISPAHNESQHWPVVAYPVEASCLPGPTLGCPSLLGRRPV
jgi:hypothetical protein